MYKRIVVAVDGSPTSELALDEAIKLAGEGKSQLLLLHVSEDVTLAWSGGDWMVAMPPVVSPEMFEEMGQKILTHAQEKVRNAGLDAELRRVNDDGRRIGNIIAQEAQDWQADLLVIGTHGRKGLDRFLLGSVAEGVMRAATVPVLLVRGT
ncbi:MAG TPA: universal stress protein [Gallionella sp.]|nr:universal stress protein [Gallionella sp.]